jgi:hypothetical protein
MGYVQIIHNWEECDKCGKRIDIREGTYTQVDGLRIFFSCKVCQ